MKLSRKKAMTLLVIYILLFFAINISSLTLFPFVHSDESWLSGLTRNMIETKSIYCTETFFNLYPRFPHTIKVLFHLLQIPFVALFGYQIFSVRIVSLIFGSLSLVIFYQICVRLLKKPLYSLVTTILLSLNIQYLYASRFARQEIILVFFFMLTFLHYVVNKGHMLSSINGPEGCGHNGYRFYKKLNPHIVLGLLIGLSIGIHPNSFLIAVFYGMVYIGDIIRRNKRIRDLLMLVSTTGIMASVYIWLSFLGDSQFIYHYTRYGNTMGVSSTFIDKILALPDFYSKLYDGVSGTYYTPPIQGYLILFAIITLVGIFTMIKRRTYYGITYTLILGILGIHIGSILIGRYNQTSIIYIFPFYYLLGSILLTKGLISYERVIPWLLACCILITGYASYSQISPYIRYSYTNFLEKLNVIPPSARTLGNLNMEFYFDNGALIDYRNLTYIQDNAMTFDDYIRDNHIEYIIHTEELDYLHRNPDWQVLYGDDTSYYDDMLAFIDTSCSLVNSFTDEVYGIRIPRYMFDYPWKINIYKVDM